MLRGFLVNKCPRIKVLLEGTSEEEVEVIVDTGFNGHLTMPEEVALRVGLVRTKAVTSSKLADGSSSPYDIYLGKVIYNDTHVATAVEVQPGCSALLGMSLLEELDLNLLVDVGANRVELNNSTKGGLEKWAVRGF